MANNLSTSKPGSVTDPAQVALLNASQVQSQLNAQPRTFPGATNGALPKLANGDNSITISGEQLIIRQGAAKGTGFTFAISSAATGLLNYQTGTVAPTVADNFPTEGQFGWYENTTGPTYYWTINHGGALKNISISTLDGWPIAFTSITGTITATQHTNFTAATANDLLHAEATTAHPGFLSTTFFDLLDGATSVSSNSTLVKRSASAGASFGVLNLETTGAGDGVLQVGGTNITTSDNSIATSGNTGNTLVRRGSGGGAAFSGTLTAATLNTTTLAASSTIQGTVITSTSSSFKSGSTQVVGAQGAAVADATNGTDVITQLNALLARLRVHGLINT